LTAREEVCTPFLFPYKNKMGNGYWDKRRKEEVKEIEEEEENEEGEQEDEK